MPGAGQSPLLDYPQWRGQHRDGGASSFVEPLSWPEALTRRWQVEVGEGYATPIVVGSRVFMFTRRDGHEVVTALRAQSGTTVWQTSYAAPYTPAQPAAAHGAGPKATPLWHRGRLFTLGISGMLSAFDATSGTLVWQTPAPEEHPFFSAAASPLGYEDLVVVHPGNYGPLTAFDVDTGAIRWTTEGDGLWSSPILVELSGTMMIVSALQESLVGVSPADGTVLWRYPWRGQNGSITPLLHRDTIIVSGLDLGVVAIRLTRRGTQWTAERAWDTSAVSMYVSNPVIVGETLFGLSHKNSGQFFAVDANSGRSLWLGPPRQADNTAVVKARNRLFLLNDDAELIVARSSRAGFEPIARYTVADTATWAQPAISGDRIFVKDARALTLWTVR